MESIKKTNRKITKIEVYFWHNLEPETFKSMTAIINKFSATIKYLKFNADLDVCDLLEILSLVANVEHLALEYLRPPPQPSKKKRRVMPNYKDLNLYQLKTLKLIHCDDLFLVLFNRLPAGVLTELVLEQNTLDELKVLFAKQTNIKKLTIKYNASFDGFKPLTFATNVFDDLKLESLELDLKDYNGRGIETMLSKQKKLQSLKLIYGVVGEDVMNVIVDHLSELKTFSMNVPDTPVDAFKNIKKLKYLQHLKLKSNDDRHVTHFEAFASSKNLTLTTLHIEYMYDISNELIAALAKSVPNLKILRFNCDYNDLILNETMKSFNFVECLQFDPLDTDHDYCNMYDDEYGTLMKGDISNPNLTELQINYSMQFKRPLMEKLIKSYPNLKKLVVRSWDHISVSQFEMILNGFKKMESLSLVQGASRLRLEDMQVFKKHRNHLKFVWLMDLEIDKFTARNKKNLCKIFDVVEYEQYNGLKMAINRATMTAEGRF